MRKKCLHLSTTELVGQQLLQQMVALVSDQSSMSPACTGVWGLTLPGPGVGSKAGRDQAFSAKAAVLLLTTPYATHTKTNSQMELYNEMYACNPGPLLGGFNKFSNRPGNLHTTTVSTHFTLHVASIVGKVLRRECCDNMRGVLFQS